MQCDLHFENDGIINLILIMRLMNIITLIVTMVSLAWSIQWASASYPPGYRRNPTYTLYWKMSVEGMSAEETFAVRNYSRLEVPQL